MASNTTAVAAPGPLAMMTKLSPFVHVYEPPALPSPPPSPLPPAHKRNSTTDPKLVAIGSWMDARDLHIAKYINRYRTLYPKAKILLVRYVFRHVVVRPESVAAMQPAILWLQSQVGHYLSDEKDEDDDGEESNKPAASEAKESALASASLARSRPPEILLHVFSNGGVASTKALLEGYRARTGRAFPRHAAVYDSCPGLYAYWRLYRAAIAGVRGGLARRLVASPLIHLLNLCLYVVAVLLRRPYDIQVNADYHNDPARARQAARAYVYGRADDMIDWRHVEQHARIAKGRGYAVRCEMFEGSSHVAHVRADEERYWRIVVETWQQAVSSSSSSNNQP
jgi:hypothetical protein